MVFTKYPNINIKYRAILWYMSNFFFNSIINYKKLSSCLKMQKQSELLL